MAMVKDLYIDIENILNDNRGWSDNGTQVDGNLIELCDNCTYIFASYNEMVEYCSNSFGEYAYKDEKILWVWNGDKNCYIPEPALSEMICDLMFQSMLKAKTN